MQCENLGLTRWVAPQELPERLLARGFSHTKMIPEKLRWVPHSKLTYLRIWVWIWLWVLGFGRWAGSWGWGGEWEPWLVSPSA